MATERERPTTRRRALREQKCDLCAGDDCGGLYEVRDNDASHFYLVGAECMRKAALAALDKAGLR